MKHNFTELELKNTILKLLDLGESLGYQPEKWIVLLSLSSDVLSKLTEIEIRDVRSLASDVDGNVHVMPTVTEKQHVESKNCWCHPKLIQAKDEEHNKEVWSHKGYEELLN